MALTMALQVGVEICLASEALLQLVYLGRHVRLRLLDHAFHNISIMYDN